jgi:hypothetical protein
MINIQIRTVIKDFTFSYRITKENGDLIGYSSPADKLVTIKCLNKVISKMGYEEITMEEFDKEAA